MFLKTKTDWKLLAKYIAGETDSGENAEVEAWAKASHGNAELLHEIKSDWKKMNRIEPDFDVDKGWSKLSNRITGNSPAREFTPEVKRTDSKPRVIPMALRVAASILLLAAMGVAVVTIASRLQKVSVTASVNEKGKEITLPDGSLVYLNTDTRLTYSRQFGRNKRVVNLDGEAFFDIKPDKNNPFQIYAGNALVKVVGTSFNVNSRKNSNQVEVYVSTGIVELSEALNQNNRILLHPGSIGLINHNVINAGKAVNANSLAWKTGTLTFVDTPLTEVITLLNNVYDVKITVKGQDIDTIKINGSYQGDPLDHILQVIGQHNPQLIIAKSTDTDYLSD